MVNTKHKETELGTIPIDWEVLAFAENFDFLPNNTYARNCTNDQSGNVRNIHYGDVLIKFDTILDCDNTSIPYLNLNLPANLINGLVQSGDIIIADTAEDDTVGKVTEVINVKNKKIVSGLHTILVRPHEGLFAEKYLGYFVNAPVYHNRLLPFVVGTKVSSISKKTISQTLILRPPLQEQHSIAAALSDADTYIAGLEKLIAKKRNIKQGAMQELLTGKRRLSDFSGEWTKKRICEISDTSSGGTPSRSISAYFEGNIPWVTTTELNDGYIYTTNEFITDTALNESSAKLFPIDTVLMAMYGATIGKLGIIKLAASTNQACCAFFFHGEIDFVFMFSMLLHHRNSIIELGSGAGQPNISQTIIRNLVFRIPPTKAEQSAIAALLSDMDAEIDGLTAKLNKAKQIKQGMMNELLTGKIRLIEEETDHGEN